METARNCARTVENAGRIGANCARIAQKGQASGRSRRTRESFGRIDGKCEGTGGSCAGIEPGAGPALTATDDWRVRRPTIRPGRMTAENDSGPGGFRGLSRFLRHSGALRS